MKPHKIMTAEEYAAMLVIGWHEVCRDVDGSGNVGVRFLGEVTHAQGMRLEKPDGWIVKNKSGGVELFLSHDKALAALSAWGSFISPVYATSHPAAQSDAVREALVAKIMLGTEIGRDMDEMLTSVRLNGSEYEALIDALSAPRPAPVSSGEQS